MPLEYRKLAVRAEGDGDDPPIRALVATENPVKMYDWERGKYIPQILLTDGMERASRVPLLDAHGRYTVDDQLGSVDNFKRTEDGIDARLSFSSTCQDCETKVREGHITDVSAGYEVSKNVHIPDGETQTVRGRKFQGPVNVAEKWKVREVSVVPIGADDQAKIRGFRSFADAEQQITERTTKPKNVMPKETQPTPPAPAQTRSDDDDADKREKHLQEFREAEKGRRKSIRTSAERMSKTTGIDGDGVNDLVNRAMDEGWDIDKFNDALLDHISEETEKRGKPPGPENSGPVQPFMSDNDTKRYSIREAILKMHMQGRASGLYAEASQEVARQLDREPESGIFLPPEVMFGDGNTRALNDDYSQLQSRAMQAEVDISAGYLVDTQLLGLVELLSRQLVMRRMGAQITNGLRGNLSWPRETQELDATWQDEVEDCIPSQAEFGLEEKKPERLSASTCYSLQLIRQSSIDIEAYVRRKLAKAKAEKMDETAINGTGTGHVPTGILNQAGVQTLTFGGPPTLEAITDFIALLCDFCPDGKFLASCATWGKWLATPVVPNVGQFLAKGNMVEQVGRSITPTSILDGAGHRVIYGDFSLINFCLWGGTELIVDPYTDGCKGVINVYCHSFANIRNERPDCFVVSTDAGNQ